MLPLSRSILLLAGATCLLAGDLAAQPRLRVDAQAAERLSRDGVALRVNRAGIDTVQVEAGLRVGAGEMIVAVTGDRPTRVRPLIRPDLVAPPRVAIPGDPTPGDAGNAGSGTGGDATGPRPSTEPAKPEPSGHSAEPKRDEPAPGPASPPRREPRPNNSGGSSGSTGSGRPGRPPAPTPAPAPPPVAYELGYAIGTGDREGDDFHVLVPIVEIEGGGLRYDPAEQAYVGTILFGLVDRDHPHETGSLPNKVLLQITGDVQSVGTVELTQINIPFKQIALRVRRPRSDSVQVNIRATFDPTGGSAISVPVLRAPFTVQASPRRIAGFGLEITELVVQATRRGDTLPVIVSSTRAKPSPAQIRATDDGAVSRIRSSGVGMDTVRVASGDFEEMVIVRFAWPVGFLLAALFGGLIGGVLNSLSTNRSSDLRTLAFLAGQGALTGAVGAVLYAVGINVVGWAPSAEYGEGLMFAVAFISGLMGPRIFDRFLPKLSVGRKDGDPPAPPAPAPAQPATPEPAAVG